MTGNGMNFRPRDSTVICSSVNCGEIPPEALLREPVRFFFPVRAYLSLEMFIGHNVARVFYLNVLGQVPFSISWVPEVFFSN